MLKLQSIKKLLIAGILFLGLNNIAKAEITSITVLTVAPYTVGVATTVLVNTFDGAGSPGAGYTVTIELIQDGAVVENGISPTSFTTQTTGTVNGGNIGFTYTFYRAGTVSIRATSSGGVVGTSSDFVVVPAAASKLLLVGPGMTYDPGRNPSATGVRGYTGGFTPQEAGQAFTIRAYLTDLAYNTVTGSNPSVSFADVTLVTEPSAATINSSLGYTDFQFTILAPNISKTITGTATGIGDGTIEINSQGPANREVFPFPSPFNPKTGTTTFRFRLESAETVDVIVTDVFGQEVWRKSHSGSAGFNDVVWNGKNDAKETVAAGVYIVMIEAGGSVESSTRFGVIKR